MFDAVTRNLMYLMGGFGVTLQLTFFALAGGIVLGMLVGLGRISRNKWVYYPVTLYVNLIRNIPLILETPNSDQWVREIALLSDLAGDSV